MHEIDFHRALYRPGTLVDVGAHDGAFTLPLAALPGAEVIAFEPLPFAFTRLTAACRGLDVTIPLRVALRPEALGDRTGTMILEVPVVAGTPQEQWASAVKDYAALQRDDPRITGIHRITVPVMKLDTLELTHVTAMKIDAEGGEAEVLRGAEATLLRCRPVLSVEIEERHRAGSTRDVPGFLAGLGYHGFYEFYGDWRPVAGFDPAALQRASPSPAAFEASHPYVFVFYFVPPERVGELAALARLP